MLRRLELKSAYRSLDKDSWPPDVPLGKCSVVYGHNGSGKSSLASLLLAIADDASPISATWEDEAGARHAVAVGQGGPSMEMAVFTKEWVNRNLNQFLDGATASAIVTLGEDAILAIEQETELAQEIEISRNRESVAGERHKGFADQAQQVAKSAQQSIADQLKGFDYQRFSKNKYSLPVVMSSLREFTGTVPSENESDETLKRLAEPTPRTIDSPSIAPPSLAGVLDGLGALLAETPTRVALESLASDPDRQRWAEQGIRIHQGLNKCLFCDNDVTSERREQLARHFDQSWFDIRGRALSLLNQVQGHRAALSNWWDTVPASSDLTAELRDGYSVHLEQTRNEVSARTEAIERLERVLQVKVEDPTATPEVLDWSLLAREITASTLLTVINEHNRQVEDNYSVTEMRYRTVLDHIIGSRAEDFRQFEASVQSAEIEILAAKEKADLAESALADLLSKRFSNSKMADTLTKDLARVYGKDHLSVTVTDDGKSYACLRGGEPATHLSDGERTTLSLLYFLRKLEDERSDRNKAERIVVVDDPSSSLDREALFATHQWLVDSLKGFGQYIVLTHDFGLLRLFVKSQGSAWKVSRKRVEKDHNRDEERFPKVAFLELHAAKEGNRRLTRVAPLPPLLVHATTEYAYLFSKVMEGVVDGTNHDRLFLLPNAARRVLEVFTSYKAPHLGNFAQRLEDLMGGDPTDNPYRDVYDFCNRYSHGEGSESTDVLDARAIHGQIRRCMEFMRYADEQHFERMCKATGVVSASI